MALRITLDVFSGRPNPTIVVNGLEARELIARLAAPRRRGAKAAPRIPPSTLGYRGFLIEQIGRADRRIPRRVRLAAGHLYAPGMARPVADPGVEDRLASPGGPLRLHPDGPALWDFLPWEMDRFREIIAFYHWRPPHRPPGRALCRCAPLWEPGWWNDGGQIQWNNNCYNYATDHRTDTYAQPGLAAGAMYGSLICTEVRAGAAADRLIPAPQARNRCPREGHLVALVVGPGWDFHWYRKGRNGYWTHKPGGTPATDRDNSGNPIADPRTADRGGYTDFCTFMVVMHGHIKIR